MDLLVPSTNHIIIAGQLVHPPHLTQEDNPVRCQFVIANNSTYKTRKGVTKKKSCFMTIITWGKLAEDCARFLDVESPVVVEGAIETPLVSPSHRGDPRIRATDIQFLEKGIINKSEV
jgi:single-stranded DNA-binding protein